MDDEDGMRRDIDGLKGLSFAFKELEMFPLYTLINKTFINFLIVQQQISILFKYLTVSY